MGAAVALPVLAATTTEIIPVAVGPGAQFDPAIKAGIVAYTDRVSGNADIWIHNLANGVKTQVTSTMGQQVLEDLDGGFVVYTDDSADGVGDVVAYRISDGAITWVTTNPGYQGNPAISGSRIVWEDDRNGAPNIFVGSVTGGGLEQPVSPQSATQVQPAISGNIVVWEDHRSVGTNGIDIYGRNLATNTEFAVAVGAGKDASPDVDGDFVVYQHTDATGNIDVYRYSISSGLTDRITTDAAAQQKPRISGLRIVWEDSRNVAAGNGWDLYGYDNGVTALVTGGPGNQFIHDLDRGDVAYTDDASGTQDVFVKRTVTTPDPTPTPTAAPSGDPCDPTSGAPVLFEKTYARSTGAPQTVNDAFAGEGGATVCVTASHVSSATVDLNGDALLGPSDFHNEASASFEIAVTLAGTNALAVELRGKPCKGDGDCGSEDDDSVDHAISARHRSHGATRGGHFGDSSSHDDASSDDDSASDDDDASSDDDSASSDDEDGAAACATMTVRVVGAQAASTASASGAAMSGLSGCSVSSTRSTPPLATLLAALGFLAGTLLLRRRMTLAPARR